MKNFPIIDKETGREYWISRSVAVLVKVFAYNKHNEKCVLAIQRGEGTPDPEFVGAYCMPCGYVDFDETIVQAAQRELKEETGLAFPISYFKLISINDNYFPEYNIAVEYNGLQHYIPIDVFGGELSLDDTKKRDELKRLKCKENNCTLFEVKYGYTEDDYNNLKNNIYDIINAG